MKLDTIYLHIFGILLLLFLLQCYNSKDKVQTVESSEKRNSYLESSLGYKTAKVTATILELKMDSSRTVGIFRIDTLHGYGPSTSPIGIGEQLNFAFTKNLLTHYEKNFSEVFYENTQHRLLIRFIDSGVKNQDNILWEIINKI
jgi:hypothetical protein